MKKNNIKKNQIKNEYIDNLKKQKKLIISINKNKTFNFKIGKITLGK